MIGKLLHRAFRANETAVHELNYLFWECTTRCNLHCRHCGSDCFAASRDVDMPLEDFLRAFDKYIVGVSSSQAEAKKQFAKIQKIFPDAFIVKLPE